MSVQSEIYANVESIRRSAVEMYGFTLDQTPAVVASFAKVPDDVWRVMLATLRWPSDNERVLAVIR